mgnify:CR=1 FL=1
MKNKFLKILLCFVVLFGLAGCGTKNDNNEKQRDSKFISIYSGNKFILV